MFAVKVKIYGVSIINPALSLFVKHLFIGQRQKASNLSGVHWSPHGSLVSIGQHFVTARVVHLPTRTEISLITESDRSGPNHRIERCCADCIYSCNSWFSFERDFKVIGRRRRRATGER